MTELTTMINIGKEMAVKLKSVQRQLEIEGDYQ